MRAGRWVGLLLVALLAGPTYAQISLKVCFEGEDVRPWRYKDGSGLNFELLARVGKRIGVKFEYEMTPWRRCFSEVQNGNVDGVLGASFKQDRLAYGVYPGGNPPDAQRSVYTDRYVVLRRKGDKVDWDGKAFSNLDGVVGVQNSYSVGSDLRAMGVSIDDGARSAADNLSKLISGRIAAMAALAGEAATLLANEPQLRDKLEVLPIPLVEKPYYLIFSPRLVAERPELAEKVWKAIAEVRQTREYRAIESETLRKFK